MNRSNRSLAGAAVGRNGWAGGTQQGVLCHINPVSHPSTQKKEEPYWQKASPSPERLFCLPLSAPALATVSKMLPYWAWQVDPVPRMGAGEILVF